VSRIWLLAGLTGASLVLGFGLLVAALVGPEENEGQDRVPGRSKSGRTEFTSQGGANSADRVVFWVGCEEVTSLNDSELDRWKRRGVDGFVCMTGQLRGLGGSQVLSGSRKASLSGANYELERTLRETKVVLRARKRGIKMYLGFYASNPSNASTPFMDWFDDRGWAKLVLPRVQEVAAAAKLHGFAGVALDQELYDRETASWDWSYRGNRHSEPEVRAKVKQRGAQLMRALVRGFPRLEVMAYHTPFPESWEALVQKEVNDARDPFGASVQVDLWDGLASVRGYRAIRFMDAIFYKTPHLDGASWGTALRYNANRVYALLSRRFSNWSYASSRVHLSPFSWIDSGAIGFEEARPPDYVAEQLAAFKKWGTGGEFANYAYAPLDDFDYEPYVRAMRAASDPAEVDSQHPKLSVSKTRDATSEGTIDLRGFATDNLAVRVVRWRDDRGRSGTAKMKWTVGAGSFRSGIGRTEWWIPGLPVRRGGIRIHLRVEDIKGLATERSIRVGR
jgi:hypothetical protein